MELYTDDLLDIDEEDLEAACEFLDRVVDGSAYPPEGTQVGNVTVRYLPQR